MSLPRSFETLKSIFTSCVKHGSRSFCDVSPHRPVIFSGIQPTGALHLGNYIGAIRHWIDLQNTFGADKTIYSIVDLHAITVRQDPATLRNNIYDLAASLIGCGLEPGNKCLLYCQSDVQEHAELGWILGTLCSTNVLRHQPQWKSKLDENGEILGLFIYPVLQAADVLLYKATHVPVGTDQLSHLYLTIDLMEKFHLRYDANIFPTLNPLTGDFAKVKSLITPDKKMSKSEKDARSRIDILDTPDQITEKIKKSVTDSIRLIEYDPVNRPGVANLIDLFTVFSGLERSAVLKECQNMNKIQLKTIVAECIIEHLTPIQKTTLELKDNRDYLDQILKQSADEAREIAARTMSLVRNLVGFR